VRDRNHDNPPSRLLGATVRSGRRWLVPLVALDNERTCRA
jgi:hypothetical protein